MSDEIDTLVDWQLSKSPANTDWTCPDCGMNWTAEPTMCPCRSATESGSRGVWAMKLKTDHRTTPNGVSYTSKSYERPGLLAWAVVGDIESFTLQVDQLMTFYPGEVREIAAALVELADHMEAQ